MDTAMSPQVPDVAIAWLARFVGSNSELAILSNVNRRWRNEVANMIVQLAGEANEEAPMSDLLLPTMARRIYRHGTEESNDLSGTFCLAWFPPMGIQITSVQLGEPTSSEDENNNMTDHYTGSCTDAFAPSGGPSYEGSENEGKTQKHQHRNVAAAAAARISAARRSESEPRRQTCSHEWRGYRMPFDVLRPFGYATDFLNVLFLRISEELEDSKMNGELSSPENQPTKDFGNRYRTTSAVRGATFARPDGFCLCWDVEEKDSDFMETDQDGAPNEWEHVRRQEFKRSRIARAKRKRDLQHLVLPRVISSSKNKHPPELLEPNYVGKRQRSLQFLNADASHAVRIMTPAFACGPVPGPITVFCVGIATEDACFFSGLNVRCEMGHMFPIDARDALIDMSPVCLVTDHGGAVDPDQTLSNNNSMDSDDSSCDSHANYASTAREFGIKCDCPVQDARMGTSLSNYVEDEVNNPKEENIYRGSMGPGLWHCYVAIFDGENSVIRIDGRLEVLHTGMDLGEDSMSTHSANVESALDGMTIGADHCFDMSLCYGDGVNGEGEGAISEIVAFKGRMPVLDLERMEQHLMEKHGIPSSSSWNPTQEDEWRRQAYGLIAQPPPWKLQREPVPLRVMAKHKAVAWHQTNAVTGKTISVPRIGSKYSKGSSDW